jgi:hypothetical protein
MSNQTLRCYDYVNHPYAAVCAALAADPLRVFKRATVAASARADDVTAQLHAKIGPLDVAADIDIRVVSTEEGRSPFDGPATRLTIVWEAKRRPGLFPTMNAVLAIYPLTATETQLELEGTYAPPLGMLGQALDATIGHRVAEATVLRFVQQIATSLRETI